MFWISPHFTGKGEKKKKEKKGSIFAFESNHIFIDPCGTSSSARVLIPESWRVNNGKYDVRQMTPFVFSQSSPSCSLWRSLLPPAHPRVTSDDESLSPGEDCQYPQIFVNVQNLSSYSAIQSIKYHPLVNLHPNHLFFYLFLIRYWIFCHLSCVRCTLPFYFFYYVSSIFIWIDI